MHAEACSTQNEYALGHGSSGSEADGAEMNKVPEGGKHPEQGTRKVVAQGHHSPKEAAAEATELEVTGDC